MPNTFYTFQNMIRLQSIPSTDLSALDVAMVGYNEETADPSASIKLLIYLTGIPVDLINKRVNENFYYPNDLTSGNSGWYTLSSAFPLDSVQWLVGYPYTPPTDVVLSLANAVGSKSYLADLQAEPTNPTKFFRVPEIVIYVDTSGHADLELVQDFFTYSATVSTSYASVVPTTFMLLTPNSTFKFTADIHYGWNNVVGLHILKYSNKSALTRYAFPNGAGLMTKGSFSLSINGAINGVFNPGCMLLFIPGYAYSFNPDNGSYQIINHCPDHLIGGASSFYTSTGHTVVVGFNASGPTNKVYVYDRPGDIWYSISFSGSFNQWNIGVELTGHISLAGFTVLAGPVFKGYCSISTIENGHLTVRYIMLHADSQSANPTLTVVENTYVHTDEISASRLLLSYPSVLARNLEDTTDELFSTGVSSFNFYPYASFIPIDSILPYNHSIMNGADCNIIGAYTKFKSDSDKLMHLCFCIYQTYTYALYEANLENDRRLLPLIRT